MWSCHRHSVQAIGPNSYPEWRQECSSFSCATSLHCRLQIQSCAHNTDVLSTTAVNDLLIISTCIHVMINVTHSAQSQNKIYMYINNIDTTLIVLTVATVNELNFWEGTIPAHSIVYYHGPNNQEHPQWCTPWTGCNTICMVKWRNQHGKVEKLSHK